MGKRSKQRHRHTPVQEKIIIIDQNPEVQEELKHAQTPEPTPEPANEPANEPVIEPVQEKPAASAKEDTPPQPPPPSGNTLPARRFRSFNININDTPEQIKYEYDHVLPMGRLLALYQSIKMSLPGQPCHIIQFASAYQSEGVNIIAFETALTAATQMGLRVFYIDTAYLEKHIRPELASKLDTTLDVLLQAGGQLDGAQVGIHDTRFVYTLLRNTRFKDAALASLENLQELLNVLRGMYDLIIIPSPALTSDILCSSLCRLVDGTIVVVEAERTRSPVLRQMKETINQNGGKIIGSIMNKRRYYIPKFIYRFI